MARGKGVTIPSCVSESDTDRKSNMSVFEHIQSMQEKGLLSDVYDLGELILAHDERATTFITTAQKIQLYVYEADHLFNTREYKKAEYIYRKALQCRKAMGKSKPATQHRDITSDIDIKYQIHLCHVEMSQHQQAIGVLESVPVKQRTPKVNMALAKMYHVAGMERSAITHYREVLKECPLALTAAIGLLQLGIKGSEVLSLMMSSTSHLSNVEWLWTWMRAQIHLYGHEYKECVSTLRQLEDRAPLRDCIPLLLTIGQAYYLNGDYSSALPVLQRVHTLDPLNLKGMETLAELLARDRRGLELENLAGHLMNVNETSPQPWLAMAHHCRFNRKLNRALYFAHKGNLCCRLTLRNVDGLILKGWLLYDIKKYPDSVVHFREALQLMPYRYEAYRGLVESYLSQTRTREAMGIANQALKHLNSSPRSLTLYALVLRTDRLTSLRARSLLERVIQQDPSYLPAVILLAELMEQNRDLEGAISLVRKTLEDHSNCRLHQVLADLLAKANQGDLARNHYTIALNLDPNNSRALEGMRILDQGTESLESVFDVETVAGSDADLRDADAEAMWSDIDIVL